MTVRPWLAVPLIGLVVVGALSVRRPRTGNDDGSAISKNSLISFIDVTNQAGIRFRHWSGAHGKKYMPETVGSGVGFLDYDNDGKLDLIFVNSTDWPTDANHKPHYPALYRNRGDGTFQDVTVAAGINIDVYGMGISVGDYDNDGLSDIYITCIGPNHLFHNDGNGKFTDVTQRAGVAGVSVEPGGIRWKWSSSSAFCDYDRDGIPDLFVCNYVKWTPQTDVVCTSRSGKKSYCAPTNFEGVACTLYRGRGDGTFEDVSAKVGILSHVGRSFGVIVADFDGDGWPDIAVTNDTSPNFLFLNERGQRFREVGVERGIAVTDTGVSKAGMGIDAADYLNNGNLGLVTGNFAKESLSLYVNNGAGLMREEGQTLGVAEPSLQYLTFGLFFFDFDLDGRQDIFTSNGHIDDYVNESDATITYRERSLLFHNEGKRFTEVGRNAGTAILRKLVGRGCTWADYNLDGSPSIAIISNNESGSLFRNDSQHGHWIGLKLRGTKSTSDAWGSVVRVKSGGTTQSFQIYGGGSFLSQRQIWPLVGLNYAERADMIEVDWPSGTKTRIQNLAQGKYYEIVEGQMDAKPFPR